MIETKRHKIALISIPFPGHSIPILKLASALSQRGHEVTFMSSSSCYNRIHSQYPSLRMIGLNDSAQAIFGKVKPTEVFKEFNTWLDQLKNELIIQKPDIIVADQMTLSAIGAAADLNIKLVLNLPGPVQICDFYGFPTLTNSFGIAGITVLYSSIKSFLMRLALGKGMGLEAIPRSLILVNSFFGLDEARSIPPNIKMIGPLSKRGETESVSKKPLDPQLEKWLGKMAEQKKDIVYVTFGSMLDLSVDFIENFYEGIKLTKYAFLWSIKKGQLPERNQNVFISSWLPQAELLKLPEVKVVVSHCGWGGVIEAIDAGKPILAVPEFADQPMNAIKLVEKKVALALYLPKKRVMIPSTTLVSGKRFKPSQLAEKLNELIINPKYIQNMLRLRELSQQTPGIDGACKEIEKAIQLGTDHLVDQEFIKICKQSFIRSFLTLSIVGIAVFLGKKYGAALLQKV